MMRYFFLVLLMLTRFGIVAQKDFSLNEGWKFREVNAGKWLKAEVPGTVHTDLMRTQVIEDPFFRDHASKLLWISEKDWEYKNEFFLSSNFNPNQKKYIVFDGLDTYADIYLNEQFLGRVDNMFRQWRFEAIGLKPGRNQIIVRFYSPLRIADSLAKISDIKRPCENNRHYLRKAQYHFGWDWAPQLPTCGIWKEVYLSDEPGVKYEAAKYADVKLIQTADSIGQSFYFRVKGQATFMKGANWVPADVFLPRITKNRYRQLLIAAQEAHFNMLRVWGGGIYEDDDFYTLCDSLGIYVWQDFMFAGAMYPGDPDFIQNVKEEAKQQILRLRKHPCIVLWCGNNEIDEAWNNWGWQKQFEISANDSMRLWKEYATLFHEVLPELVRQYDSGRAYISTSPLYGWGREKSMTHGDSHYWGLWWGIKPIDIMREKVPRFMSEYGMQAMPNWKSITNFSIPQDWDTSSRVMKAHQKHPTGYKTLSAYIQQEKLKPISFRAFAEATQEIQHRAVKTAVEAQLQSNGRCMGSLLWQFNDCWPVCSWSVIDYYGEKKKAYYTLQALYKDR
jgi:beta-mannosidase